MEHLNFVILVKKNIVFNATKMLQSIQIIVLIMIDVLMLMKLM